MIHSVLILSYSKICYLVLSRKLAILGTLITAKEVSSSKLKSNIDENQ